MLKKIHSNNDIAISENVVHKENIVTYDNIIKYNIYYTHDALEENIIFDF